jgi:hypothetical protein
MPSHAARPRTALGEPSQGLLAVKAEAEVTGIACDHIQPILLRTGVEAKAEAKSVGERQVIVNHIARIDCAGLLLQIARNNVAAIGRDIEPNMGGPSGKPTIEHRADMPHPGIGLFKANIVNEDNRGTHIASKERKEIWKAVQIIAGHLNQSERFAARLHGHTGRFDQGRLSRASRAPQQNIVRCMASGQSLAILKNCGFLTGDTRQQIKRDGSETLRHRQLPGLPDKSGRVGHWAVINGGSQTLQRLSDTKQQIFIHSPVWRVTLRLSKAL